MSKNFLNDIYVVKVTDTLNKKILNIVGYIDQHQIIGEIIITKMNFQEFLNSPAFQSNDKLSMFNPCNEDYGITMLNPDTFYSIQIDIKDSKDHPWGLLEKVSINDSNTNKMFGLPNIVYFHMIGQICFNP